MSARCACFFPRPQLVEAIVHLGFYHRDLPGALAAITQLLADQQFNIITSLVRKTSKNHGVWETLLEYRGNDTIPRSNAQECCAWVADMLCRRAEEAGRDINRFEFSVGLPLYPFQDDTARIPITSGQAVVVRESNSGDSTELIRQWVTESRNMVVGNTEAARLLATVKDSIDRALPMVFLSFPHVARRHADLVVQKFKGVFDVVRYEPRGGESISAKVLEMITRADYYIGIWHHDESTPMGNGKYGITPWMPYEYGIASALGKPKVIIHSERLHEDIWKRIDSSIATPEYSDLNFIPESLENLYQHCITHFVR